MKIKKASSGSIVVRAGSRIAGGISGGSRGTSGKAKGSSFSNSFDGGFGTGFKKSGYDKGKFAKDAKGSPAGSGDASKVGGGSSKEKPKKGKP